MLPGQAAGKITRPSLPFLPFTYTRERERKRSLYLKQPGRSEKSRGWVSRRSCQPTCPLQVMEDVRGWVLH